MIKVTTIQKLCQWWVENTRKRNYLRTWWISSSNEPSHEVYAAAKALQHGVRLYGWNAALPSDILERDAENRSSSFKEILKVWNLHRWSETYAETILNIAAEEGLVFEGEVLEGGAFWRR